MGFVRLITPLLAASLLATSADPHTACDPCSLSGKRVGGRCVCRPPFGGPSCAQLLLQPTPQGQPHAFGQRADDNVTSWGGNALPGPDGRWHLFVAAMVNGCGMEAWTSNSEVVHAIATKPEGPYRRAATALPLWAHGPQVALGPDPAAGAASPTPTHWYLFHDGAGSGDPSSLHRARNCSHHDSSGHTADAEHRDQSIEGSTRGNLIHVAPTPSGPWRSAGRLANCSDPAPLWHDGTWWVVCHSPPQPGAHGCKLFGHRCTTLQTAPSAAGPWRTVLRFPANPPGTGVWEDPFVWIDPASGSWHVIMHAYNSSSGHKTPLTSGHYYSRDGTAWCASAQAPYTTRVEHTDGTATVFASRERPKLLLDRAGHPTHLVTAARPLASPNRAFTLIQPLAGAADAQSPRPASVSMRQTVWKDFAVPQILFDPLSFGAKGDGKALDTVPIQRAMDACAATPGGGVVRFRSGKSFRIQSLQLPARALGSRDVMEIRIERGATLLVDDNRSAWPKGRNVFQGTNVTNVLFVGGGAIDGQGATWWANYHSFRPHIMDFGERWSTRSQHILVENLAVRNCPSHCLEIKANFTEVRHVTISNPPNGYPVSAGEQQSFNTDGVDCMGDPFYVHHCNISTGDDNVALHFNNTLIEKNFFGTGHGASIGSLGPGSAWLTNITLGVRLKVHPGAAIGRVWDVLYENLTMAEVQTAISIDEYYFDPRSEPTFLRVDGLRVRRLRAYRTQGPYAAVLDCQPSAPCRNVSLEDVRLVDSAGAAFLCANVAGTAHGVQPTAGLANAKCHWAT